MDLEIRQLDLRYRALRATSPSRERRLLASIAERGQQSPIIVVRDAEHWVVVDGYKRLRALQRLGHDTVVASAWQLSESEALLLERALRMGETDSPIEQGWFLCELVERFGLGQDELARRLDRSKSWVSRRIGLVKDLPRSVQQHVHEGAIGAHAAMKYLLPLARANAADCAALCDRVAAEHPTSRQLGQLYVTYTAGNQQARQLVVDKPALVLRAAQENVAGEPPVERVLDDLRIVVAVTERARSQIGNGAVDGASGDERDRVRAGCRAAVDSVQRLQTRCERELGKEPRCAEPSDSDKHSSTS
jgi:ParB family transcriptional regulator, chromosome partitioning protein